MLPASEDVDDLWKDENYENPLTNIDPDRQALYETCERKGVALTTHQCIHYCLTRPGVVSVMAGAHSIKEMELSVSYCEATQKEKDYAPVLSNVPKHSFIGNCVYCGHCAPCPKGIDIECSSCMRNCPFQVDVISKMKKAVEIFGY